jgi:hypothetical protein
MRTLEMFREIGIEDAVRSQSEKEFVAEGAIIAMDTLAGRPPGPYRTACERCAPLHGCKP